MWLFRASILSLISLNVFVSGCGFQPLYGHAAASHNTLNQLSLIRIAPIEDRIGQKMRNFLQDHITPLGKPNNPSYELIVKINKTRSDLVLLQDATSTFAKVTLHASYSLVDIATRKSLTSGNVTAKTGFTITESEYANIHAETGTTSRAARELSYDIARRLALFLKTIPTDK
jgi:LPS-assembly lipoprotein